MKNLKKFNESTNNLTYWEDDKLNKYPQDFSEVSLNILKNYCNKNNCTNLSWNKKSFCFTLPCGEELWIQHKGDDYYKLRCISSIDGGQFKVDYQYECDDVYGIFDFIKDNNKLQKINESNDIKNIDFNIYKKEVLFKINELLDIYDDFSKEISPSWWRSSGSHFADLKKMKEDIERYTPITEDEREKSKKWLE